MPDRDAARNRSLAVPILMICIGALFLYRIWQPAFQPFAVIKVYWPLALIFIGLGKMWDSVQGAKKTRANISIGATVGVLLFVLVIVVLLWRGNAFSRDGRYDRQIDHISEVRDLQGATSLSAVITMPAGELNLSGGTSHALDGDFDYSAAWSRPSIDYHVSGTNADLDISQDNHGPTLGPDNNTWRVQLNDKVPVEVEIKMGAAQGNLKLREMNLKRLTVNMGVGQVNVDLTGDRAADADVEIHGGIGQAKIRLPKNVGVTVDAKGGIGAVTTHGLKQVDGNYVNDALGHAPHTLHVQVAGGIGNIDLSVEP
ncbi:MAG TPA: toast rack family protein [Candidatus Acidoferrum sp.]|nr:toast rack family protein [Candidatus Acidoferrum sp.]